MLSVLSIFGTRPEAIKMAPVILALRRQTGVRCVVCSTGQHRDLLPPICELFAVRPDIELEIMQPDQSLPGLTARLLDRLEGVVRQTAPDWIVAQGDTTTVLAAALTAYYGGVRFAHVEAGLRTGDLWRPFPEELNRRVADDVAELLFAPTARCRDVLLREGRRPEQVLVTGNTVVDALQRVAVMPYDWSSGPLRNVPLDGRLVLVTVHRRESFGPPLEEICRALAELAERVPDVRLVLPLHPNPRVRGVLVERLQEVSNLSLTEPLDYLSLVQLMRRSVLILTDSGGIQEEAPTLRVPVLVLRDKTERPEGMEAGLARLVGTDRRRIVAEAARLLTNPEAHAAMCRGVNPYGDGQAAERIVAALMSTEPRNNRLVDPDQ